MPVRRKKSNNLLLTILSIILLLLFLLRFDAVASAIDPDGKMGLAKFANDTFPIVLGSVLVIVGIAAAATVWVAIALIAVGVGMVAFKAYDIYKRNAKTQSLAPNA